MRNFVTRLLSVAADVTVDHAGIAAAVLLAVLVNAQWRLVPDATPANTVAIAVGVLVGLAVIIAGWRLHPQRRAARILRRLDEAERHSAALRSKLIALGEHPPPPPPPPRQSVRIWMDGAFDMMHYGHVNAFRQGRALGTHLVVGVNSDASIAQCKGPPVMNDSERLAMIEACKFVDEVVPNVPYVMDAAYVAWVIKAYKIDYVVHGDDPCIVDGKDVYESAKALGKYKSIPRTEGVSTTEIVGRMLTLTTDHHAPTPAPPGSTTSSLASTPPGGPKATSDNHAGGGGAAAAAAPPDGLATPAPRRQTHEGASSFVRESKFITTSRMLRLFASGCASAPKGARVVYVDGGWDMFHAGHVDLLRRARSLGDFLLVGVHSDVLVNSKRGANFPIMNLNERTLSVLSCRYVGDVVIDPPWHMTREMIAALDISVVAHGSTGDSNDDEGLDPYAVPKSMGIYSELRSEHALTVDVIVSRLEANREKLQEKINRKAKIEGEYYQQRYGFETPTASA